MGGFTSVKTSEAKPDAVNIAGTPPVDPLTVFFDLISWSRKAFIEGQEDSVTGEESASAMQDKALSTEGRRTVASVMQGYVSDTQNLASLVAASSILNPGTETTQFDSDLRELAARHAFSRLLGALSLDGQALDGLDPYTVNPREKLILDFDHTRHGACSVIVDRAHLQEPPFEGKFRLRRGGQWYFSEEQGLYVLASPDVTLSPGAFEQLTLATGSPDNAKQLIDAQNSVALRPYLSLSFLEGPSS